MLFSELYKIIVIKVTIAVFRQGNHPIDPLESAPECTSWVALMCLTRDVASDTVYAERKSKAIGPKG